MNAQETHLAGDDEEPARLSMSSFGLALAITLGIFFFLNPFWESLDVVEVDQNIWWSYAPIPLLVLGLLRMEKKLSRASWFLETLKLLFVKFAITYLVGNIWWTLVDTPAARVETTPTAQVSEPADRFALHAAPPPTSQQGVQLGALRGQLLDASGAAVPNAFVYVSAGLGDQVFATPETPLVLEHVQGGFDIERAVLQCHRELVLRAAPDALHTAELRDMRGKALFNFPLVAGGQRELMFARERGVVSVQCRVHGQDERPTQLAILSHPFVTITDAEGRFALSEVPLNARELSVWADSEATLRLALKLEADTETLLELRLP